MDGTTSERHSPPPACSEQGGSSLPEQQPHLRARYRRRSWVREGIESRPSPLGGRGLFTRVILEPSERVIEWGGELFSAAQLAESIPRENSLATLGEGLFVGSRPETPVDLCEYMNHACSPNLWLIDEKTLVARRRILPEEELTADYASFESEPSWEMPCACAAPSCRRLITGKDWALPGLAERLDFHLSPYLLARLRQGRR